MPDPPTSDPEQFVQGVPVLHVPDVKATAAYYRDILGFQWDFGDDRTRTRGTVVVGLQMGMYGLCIT